MLDTLVDIEAAFAPFLALHPFSTIEETTSSGTRVVTIQRPWNDDSVQITVPENYDELSRTLNEVYLPPRLSAFWHRDSKEVEIIWTALPLLEDIADIDGRKFDFGYLGNTYRCGFSESSDRALKIAELSDSLHLSQTAGRNLESFRNFMRRSESPENEKIFEGAKPISFWLRGIDVAEQALIEMIEHLNFYMKFYDVRSPTVIVHPPSKSTVTRKSRVRFIAEEFPSTISAAPIDSNLLSYWDAAQSGDSARRFVYYFRIIEYAASVYVDHSTRFQIRKILGNPVRNTSSRSNEDDIIAAVRGYRADDHGKMEAVIKDFVSPDLLWKEVKQNIEYFSENVDFDGGYKLDKLIAKGGRDQDFMASALTNFHKYIRDIRNALSHGQDKKTAQSILPTDQNIEKLRPWTALIAIGAGQVMMFRDVL